MENIALFTAAGLDYLFRWGHFLAGTTWVGLLYYFNFVQAEYFKEAEAAHRSGAVQKLVPRALLWFRWGAMLTFLTGLYLFYRLGTGAMLDIAVGATLGTMMFLNVWLIIWPNQQIVIASATRIAAGGEADPAAAGAAPKATLASRTNTMFSIPLLFFMGSSAHLPSGLFTSASITSLVVLALVILALEANAIFGKVWIMSSIKGVIGCGFGLTAVLYSIVAVL